MSWPSATRPEQQSMRDAQATYGAPLLGGQECMMPSAPPLEAPWHVGPQNMYQETQHAGAAAVPLPPELNTVDANASNGTPEEAAWHTSRKTQLRDWGRRRERSMHRSPRCLMDQMVSGSGLYPLRLLDDGWFSDRERQMIKRLECILQGTGHAPSLARDLLAPLIYDIDVRIVLDNSGSMQMDMFGTQVSGYPFHIDSANPDSQWLLEQRLKETVPVPFVDSLLGRTPVLRPAVGAPSPGRRRWYFARDALRRWAAIFGVMGLDPVVHLLNPMPGIGKQARCSDVEAIFRAAPQGSTPMTEALQSCVREHKASSPGTPDSSDLLHLLVLTDGEANNMPSFNRTLDEIQNGWHGDVQVCLMGLSLVKEDIEWFEDEECGDSRIRTVEAFEVEQRQIQLKEVVLKESGYNFEMHSCRVLVTNYFPADYDYEAPLQNLRHRLYITLHGKDRWFGLRFPLYYCLSQVLCSACFLGTCCHCAGWCQGHNCGKCHRTDLVDKLNCLGEE